jgi:glycosyltransferase involved in cell wall biosynthesis
MPTVDVVIPAFNSAPEELARALASVRAIDRPGTVVVVDDGSDPPIGPLEGARVERQANAGPSAARNRGLALTRAEWVLLLDADDQAIGAGVSAMVALGEKTGAAAVLAGRWNLHPDGRRTPEPVPPEWSDRTLPSPGDVFRPLRLFGATGVLVSRRALDAGVRFDETLKIGEDRDFLRRCADVGPIAVSSEPALVYTLPAGGRSSLSSSGHTSRRIADHLVLLERYCDGASEDHFREATAWLINRASKVGVSGEDWDRLTAAARARGWRVPLKPVVRRLVRRVVRGGGA